ncbi:MAG TPA: hypothetical protein VIL42_10770 [Sphingomicrobium sp.]
MSNKNVREACDLMRFNCVVRIDCACGNSRLMGGLEALRTFGKTPIKSYAERLRCSRCGGKRARVQVDTVPLR